MRGIVLAAGILAAGPAVLPAQAQMPAAATPSPVASDPYTIRDLKVDATAANPLAARDLAIADGQRKAFQELFRRLAGPNATPPKVGNTELERMIQGFEIDDERTSAVRYLATLTVTFRPAAVRQILLAAGAAFADAPSRPVLVLAVDATGNAPVLWEDSTAWANAWAVAPVGGHLMPIILPAGEIQDVSTVSTREAVEGTAAPLAALARHYNAGEVLVAQLLGTSGVRFNPANGVQVILSRHPVDSAALAPPETVSVPAKAGENLETLLGRAVAASLDKLDETLRQGPQALRGGVENRITATVPLRRLEDWLEIRRRLGLVSALPRADLLSLSRTEAEIALQFHGEPSAFQAALAQRQLLLSTGASGNWELRTGQ